MCYRGVTHKLEALGAKRKTRHPSFPSLCLLPPAHTFERLRENHESAQDVDRFLRELERDG